MKDNIHPKDYRKVVFEDISTGKQFIINSCATSKDTIKVDDQEMPMVKVHISSDTHPFYTGEAKVVDTEGRVDSFKRRAEEAAKKREQMINKAKKAKKAAEKKANTSSDDENSTDEAQPVESKQEKATPPAPESSAEKESADSAKAA